MVNAVAVQWNLRIRDTSVASFFVPCSEVAPSSEAARHGLYNQRVVPILDGPLSEVPLYMHM